MKWEDVILYEQCKIGVDELDNDILEKTEYIRIKARFTPWSMTDINLQREVTKSSIKIITFSSNDALKKSIEASIGDKKYLVRDKGDLGRFRYMVLEGYRQ